MAASAKDRRTLRIAAGGLLIVCSAALAQNDTLGRALDAAQQAQRASTASQQRIDQLDDQTRALLERYRSATWRTQQLNVYAQQLDELLAQQSSIREGLKMARELTAANLLELLVPAPAARSAP
ncbi:MAG: DUF3450 family protein [Solimonas sp.]